MRMSSTPIILPLTRQVDIKNYTLCYTCYTCRGTFMCSKMSRATRIHYTSGRTATTAAATVEFIPRYTLCILDITELYARYTRKIMPICKESQFMLDRLSTTALAVYFKVWDDKTLCRATQREVSYPTHDVNKRNEYSSVSFVNFSLQLKCFAATLVPGHYCIEIKSSNDEERSRLPELLTELDVASEEASVEDVKALSKLVKRLASDKNGEYLKIQEITGQPGVDYPALTTIPATTFSCRGQRGGYYADLETNCQVFHICDNGRKISFLCPNGTIFQQSQLICDWWFKVDCARSAELYEQSSEYLAEEERKRVEKKKMTSEFHRTNNDDNYHQNVDYDGRQNGRSNPFGQSASQNQLSNDKNSKSNQNHNDVYEKQASKSGSQIQYPNHRYDESTIPRPKEDYRKAQSNRQLNQLYSNDGKNVQSVKFYNHQGKSNQEDVYYGSAANLNAQREDKQAIKPNKPRTFTRQNFNAGVQKVTPVYTEATTFRTSTASPIREFQHLAESAAFVSSRNNGKFRPPNSNQYNSFFTSSNKATTSTPQTNNQQSTATTTGNTLTSPQNLVRSRVTIPPFPGPTYTPIYKPRTTTPSNDEAQQSTTLRSYTNTEYFRQNNQNQGTTYRNSESTTNYPDVATTYSPFNFAKNFGEKYTNPPPTDDGGERYTTYAPTTQRPVYARKETTSKPETITTNYDSGEFTTQYTDNYSGSFTTARPVYRENAAFGAVNDIQADDTARFTPSKFVNNPQNQVAASTERSNNNSTVPRRTPSPYDTSITYQHGKELSTLGPYVPFTKSYAFTTSTTPGPSFQQNFNQLTRNLPVGAKAENYVSSDYGKSGNRATYLPERTTPSPYANEKSNFDNRPVQEREHALNMLKSLQGLEGTVPNLNLNNINNTSYNFEPKASAGPSTLHSLALYFANTDEDYNTEGPTDSVINFQYFETTPNPIEKKNTSVIDLPTSILTQHTISSYIELFNLNNALENNITGDTSYDMSDDENFADEDSSDLDIQQSEGPLNGVKKSNNTKLRELAQVFTQALSAYLQDPDTFKRVLTEIRPTEPQNIENEITTDIPTTTEDYPSVTKEKDEVLDFSDDINGIRRRRPITTTTVVPETTKNDSNETTYQPYYTPDYFARTTPYPDESLNEAQSSYTQPKSDNRFSYGGNAVFDSKKINYKSNDYNNGKDYSNYLPNEQSRYGGFQNNSATTYSPYGKNVKPSNSTPISDNYVASSTPATYEIAPPQNFVPSQSSIDTNLKLSDVLTPPAFSTSYSVSSTANTAPISTTTKTKSVNTGTSGSNVTPVYKRPQETTTSSTTTTTTTSTTTKEPFRIRYYDPTTVKPRKAESLVTASSSNTNFKNSFNNVDSNERKNEKSASNQKQSNNENNFNKNNHNNQNNHLWTSSPTVTQLWETTVFIDPDHINRGLDSGEPRISQPSSNIDFRSTTVTPRDELFANEASNSVTPQNFANDQSTPWQWAPNNNDSPTAFTLLPNINFAGNDNTATPTPTYTTRSSITTTITSSITATNAVPPTSPDVPTRISIFNITENEIQMAHNMFGSLNESSSNTLMKVMKQADNNATVRQLVLLLISHCNGPQNKTMEEEKEEVLNALLKLPVNEFTSEESRELIKGISKLHLPLGKDAKSPSTIAATTSAPITSTTPGEPVVTTYRSRSGRKFKASTVKSNSSYAKVASNNNPRSDRKAKSTEEGTISDSRALDLLRSLYTIAAKWG
uniref:Chitin-binding type-2 domain-containing protein n=1 Tax=Trichogramma kaykai TaxID=54128 RepID=A0ABD2WM21_9HYME